MPIDGCSCEFGSLVQLVSHPVPTIAALGSSGASVAGLPERHPFGCGVSPHGLIRVAARRLGGALEHLRSGRSVFPRVTQPRFGREQPARDRVVRRRDAADRLVRGLSTAGPGGSGAVPLDEVLVVLAILVFPLDVALRPLILRVGGPGGPRGTLPINGYLFSEIRLG